MNNEFRQNDKYDDQPYHEKYRERYQDRNQQEQYQQQYQGQYYEQPVQKQQKPYKEPGMMTMILGITGIVMLFAVGPATCGLTCPFALVIGIIGYVIGKNEVKSNPALANESKNKAGRVMNIINIIFGALSIVLVIVLLATGIIAGKLEGLF